MESEPQAQGWATPGGVLRGRPNAGLESHTTRLSRSVEATSENRPLGALDSLDSCIAW